MNAYAKALAVLLVAALAALGGWYFGSEHTQAEWDASKAQIAAAEQAAIAKRLEENAAIEKQNAEVNAAITKAYDEKIADLSEKYAAARAAGGLRIPAASCPRPASQAATASAGRADDAATVELPAETQERLYSLAEDADRTSLQLIQLQDWIRHNGLSK